MQGNWASPESVRASLREVGAFERELREAIQEVERLAPKPVFERAGFRLFTSPAMPPDEIRIVASNFGVWRFRFP